MLIYTYIFGVTQQQKILCPTRTLTLHKASPPPLQLRHAIFTPAGNPWAGHSTRKTQDITDTYPHLCSSDAPKVREKSHNYAVWCTSPNKPKANAPALTSPRVPSPWPNKEYIYTSAHSRARHPLAPPSATNVAWLLLQRSVHEAVIAAAHPLRQPSRQSSPVLGAQGASTAANMTRILRMKRSKVDVAT
jgi:hypothetical protein